jgi:hypothetical protein
MCSFLEKGGCCDGQIPIETGRGMSYCNGKRRLWKVNAARHAVVYRGTSLIRNHLPLKDLAIGLCLGPHGGFSGEGDFL